MNLTNLLNVDGTDLYHRNMEWAESNGDRGKLMHQVWDGTPWMVDVYTGNIENFGRFREIMEWCREQFGPEAWPIHGKPGAWHSGGATVMGWTWIGFATEDRMERFRERWIDV